MGFARAISVPKKFLRFGMGFAVAAILAGRARHLPFWQLVCHLLFGTTFATANLAVF